ncbi:hypothetical protein Q7P37_002472 [Cladosporium fusiforme]
MHIPPNNLTAHRETYPNPNPRITFGKTGSGRQVSNIRACANFPEAKKTTPAATPQPFVKSNQKKTTNTSNRKMAPQKKRKLNNAAAEEAEAVDTSRPSAVFKPTKGRAHTLSLALPGSIIANCSTHEMKNALAGQIARACAVFCVDEIVIFDDGQAATRAPERDGYTAYSDPNFFLYHVLSYLETPPHLRKALFPMHPDLRTAGALPSLDMPHHLRGNEYCPFREGVSVGPSERGVTMLDCGLPSRIPVRLDLEAKTRLTVRVPEVEGAEGEAVAPDTPREEAGYYWGYSVRQAGSLGGVFTECPFDGGYDMSVGTSERGVTVANLLDSSDEAYVQPAWKHLVIVFGGVAGLEAALSADRELQKAGVSEVKDLFDRWVNLVPGQGSRTIRTEEAVWVGLTGLRSVVEARQAV